MIQSLSYCLLTPIFLSDSTCWERCASTCFPIFAQLRQYKGVISTLRKAQASRNRLMHHGVFHVAATDRVRMAVGSARGTLKTATHSLSVEDIKKVSVEIDEAQRALYKLVLGRNPPPSWTQTKAYRAMQRTAAPER